MYYFTKKGRLKHEKIFNLAMVFLIILGVISLPKIVAASPNNSGALNIDKEYLKNKKYYDDLEKQRDKEIEKKEKNSLSKQATKKYTINVTYFKQEYYNFCGVASGVQALSFHKSKSGSKEKLPTQKHFGNTIGVLPKGAGTSSTKLANGLNQYKHVYKFKDTPYIVGNIAQFDKPETKLKSRVRDTLSGKKTAPILLLRTDFLKNYEGKEFRHYVTVSGYDETKNKMRLVDPNHHTKYTNGGIYWAPIGTKTSAYGITKAMYEADKESENPVMVW